MKLTVGPTTIASLSAMAVVLAASTTAQPGRAATLTNADTTAYTITVIKKATRETKNLAPGALLKDLCKTGCIVRIDDNPEKDFILEGSERVTVEGGLLYYDGEVAGESGGDTTKSTAPKR